MNLRRTMSAFCLLLVFVPALHGQVDAKKQAKALAEKAKNESGDHVKQAQDICAAATLQPKEKKYVESCNSLRGSLILIDRGLLTNATVAYNSDDLDKAASLASQVSTFDEKLSGEAKSLLNKIASYKLLSQVKSAWSAGDFKAVLAQAQGIDDPGAKAAAKVYINKVNQYKGYIQQAQSLEDSNPQEAIKQLGLAQSLNPKGPNNPAKKINELQKALQAKGAKPSPASSPKPADAANTDYTSKLIVDAQNAEKQGNLQDALKNYAMVLKLRPNNQEAQSNTDRIEKAIKSDPGLARMELIYAVRSFHHAQFDESQRALRDYLSSPQTVQNPGVAYFYLGASLLADSRLKTPTSSRQELSAEALSAFKEAKKANYKPVRSYVSPALLKIWDATGP